MTISDTKRQEFAARGTGGSTLFAATALSAALIILQHSAAPIDPDRRSIRRWGTEGTASEPLSLRISEMEIFKQINRVYDDLLRSQMELDAESKRAVYSNLWDLYV